jgi:urease accessory protein
VTARSPQKKSAGLQGHLRLTCAVDAEGRSHVREQSFRVPAHFSKPFLDNGVLVVNLVTPTAGLFSGDRLDIAVRVETGARLLLTSPSATRVHRTTGEKAQVVQDFSVAAGARLEVWPEIFIPQAGARYRQTTRIEVARDGELLFIEMLTPGRVASGEVFAFDELEWETDICQEGERVARERYRLSPGTASVQALSAFFSQAYQVTCFVMSERLGPEAECWREIAELHRKDLWIGCSRLVGSGSVIKLLACDSIPMRKCVNEIRRILYAAAGWEMPSLRRG